MPLLFDIETNGLLPELNTIHCLVIKDTETKKVDRYNGDRILAGLMRLVKASHMGTVISGHNVIDFDIPAIQKVFPWFDPDMRFVRDTLIMSRVIYSDIGDKDAALLKKGKLDGKLFKSHSLKAWGQRLGFPKDDYADRMKERGLDPWAEWSMEMEDYCVIDVEVTHALWDCLADQQWPEQSIELEHDVFRIIRRQMQRGFAFDVESAQKLYAKLSAREHVLRVALVKEFGEFFLPDGARDFVPKKGNKANNYVGGAPLRKIKLVEFNPSSRAHIVNRLKVRHGWEPTEFTEKGEPKMDETVMRGLQFPEAKLLEEYFTVIKRLGQVGDGDEAWLKRYRDGAIFCRVSTNGAVTGRMTHSSPNLAQVPASHSPYGVECRSCFVAREGYVLVGIDAAALELRNLAGYMALYDNGAYINTVVNGKKSDGTEIHTVNRKALEIDSRDDAKTWFYAFIYGAGDEKLGTIITKIKGMEARDVGSMSRAKFQRNLPALGRLVKDIATAIFGKKAKVDSKGKVIEPAVKGRGYLRGLDGRRLPIRSKHAALNTLLQSAGAVLMKKALVILDRKLQEKGYVPGEDYEFVANVHDEWQIEARPSIAEDVGRMGVEAIREAGEFYKFACPLDGEYKVGKSWADTH